MWGISRRLKGLVGLGACVAAVAAFADSPATAAVGPSASSSLSTRCLNPSESLARIAADIVGAGGKPTALGSEIIQAAQTGNVENAPLAAGLTATSTTSSVGGGEVATNVQTESATNDSASATARSTRTLAGVRRTLGTNTWLPFCGVGFTANATWYCAQGSSYCNWQAGFQGPVPTVLTYHNGGCSIVNVALALLRTQTSS